MTAFREIFRLGVDVSLYCHQPGPLMDAAVRLAEILYDQGIPFRIVDLGRKARPLRLPQQWAGRVDYNPTKHNNIVVVEFNRLAEYSILAEYAFIDRRPWGIILGLGSVDHEKIESQLKVVEGVIVMTEADALVIKAIDPKVRTFVCPIDQPRPLRIATLHRGPIRPSPASVSARLPRLAEQFREQGAICESYLATWRESDREALDAVWTQVDHVLTYNQPSDDYISQYLKRSCFPFGLNLQCKNAFYQYYMAKRAIADLEAAGPYDFIVHSRTDLDVDLGSHLNDWLIKGDYNTWHVMMSNAVHIADQFAIADPATMRLAWDYGSEVNLGEMLEEVYMPEFVLQRNIDRAGIVAVNRPFESCQIDRGQ